MTQDTSSPHDQWLADYQKQLNEALTSLADQQPDFSPLIRDAVMRGRKIRSVLALLYVKWQNWNIPSGGLWLMMRDLARVEFIHSASCIMDDIIGGDTMRRGLPAFHARNGMPQAILTSLMMMVRAIGGPGGWPGSNDIMQRTMRQMIIGEAWDSFLAIGEKPLPEQLRRLYLEKSTASFEATHAVVAHYAGKNTVEARRAEEFGGLLGALYQACNDYYDTFFIPLSERGKEGGYALITLSIPLTFLIQKDPAMRSVLGQRISFQRFRLLQSAMVTCGAESDTRDFIDKLKSNLRTLYRHGHDDAELPTELVEHIAAIDSLNFWKYKYTP